MRFLSMITILLTAILISFTFKSTLNRHAIVRLLDLDGNFVCSGTVINSTTVLTAAHCIVEQDGYIQNGEKTLKVPFVLIAMNSFYDVALIKGDFANFATAQMVSDPYAITSKTTKKLMSCGYPMGGALFCSEFAYKMTVMYKFLGFSFLYKGMSGGPVFDEDTGEVIAVNTAVDHEYSVMSPTINIYDLLSK